jgi:predicted O-linked N-acetylglucosamine transferase (SPINDLY family)|tara:strand:- start:60 stop:458 length:399 start_codon:yes stop_codon:yes gene_type:complete
MKKIFAWLSGGVIKEIGNVIDKLTTTEEEKLEIKKQVQIILEEADNNAQQQVTDRWNADMNSDSWMAKNIRPLVLVFLTFVFSLLAFTDGNIGEFKIANAYIPIFQTLLVTVYGAYFVGRTWEKAKSIIKNK